MTDVTEIAGAIGQPAMIEELVQKIHSRTARVGVIGLGYVGLPLLLLFEEAGFPVVGFG